MPECVIMGKSCMNRLKDAADSTDHFGIPLGKRLLEDVKPLSTWQPCLPLRMLDNHFLW